MKVRSTIIPSKYEISKRIGNLVEIAFFCDIEEVEVEEETHYEYSVYNLRAIYRDDLEDSLNNNYDDWLALARENDFNITAEKVREKRNQLLAESDEHLLLDRLGIIMPSDITSTNLLPIMKEFFDNLKEVLSGEWAKYRQELRDISKQKGFPYDVTFPKKPKE